MRKTKIICTVGPASENKETLKELVLNGANIFRLNFSHGNHEEHLNRINNIREVENETGKNIAILLDTKGPEIRLGDVQDGQFYVETGDEISFTNDEIIGTKDLVRIQVKELFNDIQKGDYLLIDDGKVRVDVLENNGTIIKGKVANAGFIKSKKGVNVPNVKLSMPFISEKDEKDLIFGCVNNVDYIAASFVRRAEDVLAIKKIIAENGRPKIKIIAKIENQEGYDNIESILEVVDGVMVARGDLGVEVSTALVPLYQKIIIAKANEFGKPVITATHMLESMTGMPRPTRAEASDVANAVLDGSDAIMLSGETAAGKYPIEAVKTMDTIATATEGILNYREKLNRSIETSKATIQDAIGSSVANTALTLEKVKAIVAFTQGGSTARRISKFRPSVPIIAVTFTQETKHQLAVHWGVYPVCANVQNNLHNDDELASFYAKQFGLVVGDLVIITAGYPTGEGTANMMKIVEVK
ncbi:MAG: pyruvate kinase [Erysipelotrichaceae bacterium]